MRLLVTNDDGIDSTGLHVLATALAAAGHEVVVVAPDHDYSGAGASLGGFSRLDVRVVTAELPGHPEIEAHALAGPPGMCVLAAQMGAFGPKPDLIVSGINPGFNVGRAVLHSGTVGAVLTAQNFGGGGLAVSTGPIGNRGRLSSSESVPVDEPTHDEAVAHYRGPAEVAVEVLATLADEPEGTVWSLNVPGGDRVGVRGLRWARLASFGEVQTAASVEGDRLQIKVSSTRSEPDPDTDQGLVAQRYATLSNLVGIRDTTTATTSTTSAMDGPVGGRNHGLDRGEVVTEAVAGAPVELVRRGEAEPLTWAD
jgi:5'-nucleotidase